MDNFRGTPKFGINNYNENCIGMTGAVGADTVDITKSIGDINMNTSSYDYSNMGINLSDMKDISFSDFDVINLFDKENIPYKYAEDRIIADFKAYIDKTYSEHYKTEQQNIECFDAWIALDDATPTFRNTALKYLWRYGKKNGSNKNDLMKALHYTLMCLYNDHYKDGK